MNNNNIRLFVYGTLRSGESLAHLLPADAPREPATMQGRLYYAPGHGKYPVFVYDGVAETQGELVTVNLWKHSVAHVVLMEIEAGYSAEWLVARTETGLGLDALTFTWNPADGLGNRIWSGDWCNQAED